VATVPIFHCLRASNKVNRVESSPVGFPFLWRAAERAHLARYTTCNGYQLDIFDMGYRTNRIGSENSMIDTSAADLGYVR
jgi:hypothetical protein